MQVPIAAEERNWSMAAHLSALVAIAGLPFGHILGPLVVYLVKGHESEFVGQHARASLNYQITVSIFAIVAVIVAVAVTLCYLIPMSTTSPNNTAPAGFAVVWVVFAAAALIVVLFSIIFIVQGTIAAGEGRPYTYPFAIRFLR
jgi:uncharacterized protein